MKKIGKINELLGVEGKPIKLSELDDKLATVVAAPESGTKDNKPEDDKVKVNTEAMVAVGGLSPAQKEVIPMKALAFALGYLDNKQPNLDEMEAIVSADMYIMDGHHRWAAATLVDPAKQVKVAKIEMPATDLITALNVYTKGALKLSGNKGEGDLTQWKDLIKQEIEKSFEKGFTKEDGNGLLPGGKENWPMFSGGKGKTAEEVKAIFSKIPGANGDASKGKEIMITNSQKLKTTKLPTAPERIDMPVIDAGKTPTGEKTNDVKKSQLYDICLRIQNGTLDLKPPYSSEVSSTLGDKVPDQKSDEDTQQQQTKESRVIKTYEKFIQQYNK
jgi:hypothetical protein